MKANVVKRRLLSLLKYAFLILLGFIMTYPLIWLLLSSFKPNHEIFGSASMFPKEWVWDSYVKGWQGSGQFTYTTFFSNTFAMVIPTVLGTLVSSVLTAYGFARFNFKFKGFLFALVISALLLPQEVLIIPRFILFNNLGWVNTYYPFIIPALFGTYSFFIFMLVQFIRSIPRALDESATIDGCNSFRVLWHIILPLCRPSLFSLVLLQFVWRWNDFFNVLIYISKISKYPVSLALRMSIDLGEAVAWNQLMAMSMLVLLPPILLYVFAQNYFVEGMSKSGIKG